MSAPEPCGASTTTTEAAAIPEPRGESPPPAVRVERSEPFAQHRNGVTAGIEETPPLLPDEIW